MTAEGRVAWQTARSAGVWRRAGMVGGLAGIDWPAALARCAVFVPGGADAHTVELLEAIETGRIEGEASRTPAGGGDDE